MSLNQDETQASDDSHSGRSFTRNGATSRKDQVGGRRRTFWRVHFWCGLCWCMRHSCTLAAAAGAQRVRSTQEKPRDAVRAPWARPRAPHGWAHQGHAMSSKVGLSCGAQSSVCLWHALRGAPLMCQCHLQCRTLHSRGLAGTLRVIPVRCSAGCQRRACACIPAQPQSPRWRRPQRP